MANLVQYPHFALTELGPNRFELAVKNPEPVRDEHGLPVIFASVIEFSFEGVTIDVLPTIDSEVGNRELGTILPLQNPPKVRFTGFRVVRYDLSLEDPR